MGRRKTGWRENVRYISAGFNITDPQQAKAYEMIKEYQAYGRSAQSIITTAMLASEGQQFQEPTLGDVAAHQVMVSVRELGELIEEIRSLRVQVGHAPEPTVESDEGETDYADQVMAFMKNRKKRG